MLKKIVLAMMLTLSFALFSSPSFADQKWDAFVAKMEQRAKIKEVGLPIIEALRQSAPQGSEEELWLMTKRGETKSRAAAAVALVDRMFPEGDPSRWEEVSGFLPKRSVQPRQLLAVDALFSAVASMRELPDGVWGSAYLLDRFGKSAMGRLKFIDDIPAELRAVLDKVIEETQLSGDWSSSVIRGRMPMLPLYRGYITRNHADSEAMQYLDGYGSLSGNGRYAWDRDRNYIYEIIDNSFDNRRIVFD